MSTQLPQGSHVCFSPDVRRFDGVPADFLCYKGYSQTFLVECLPGAFHNYNESFPSSMNGIILLASPRKNGNTHRLAGYIKEKMARHEIQINQVDLYDLHIEPCIDCRKCKSGDQLCTLQDDLQALYPRLEKANFILFGTPVYWSAPTAQMKLLIDRLRPYYVNRKLSGMKTGIFLSAADGSADCDISLRIFRRLSKALGMKFSEAVMVKAYDASDLQYNEKLEKEIQILTDNLLAQE